MKWTQLFCAVLVGVICAASVASADCDPVRWWGNADHMISSFFTASASQITNAVYNDAYADCGPPSVSLREDNFPSCGSGTCTSSEQVRGLSFSLGGYDTVEEHQTNVLNGWALGWHSSNYLSCGSPSANRAAGAQCASFGGQVLDLGAYNSTASLSGAMNLIGCVCDIKLYDTFIMISQGNSFGHTAVVADISPDTSSVTTAELCQTVGYAAWLSWPISIFSSYNLYRHPDCDVPWAQIKRRSFESGQVVFASVKEIDCGGYRLLGSNDGEKWSVASATIPAQGGGSEYAVTPNQAFAYYRIESLDLSRGAPKWINQGGVEGRDREATQVPEPLSPGRPRLTVVPENGTANHPGLASYVDTLRMQGFDVLVAPSDGLSPDELLSRERGRDRHPILWTPKRDRLWLERDKSKKTSTTTRRNLLLAPVSLNLPVETWASQKQSLGWDVLIYEFDDSNLGSFDAVVDSLKLAYGPTHITAFGATYEWNGSGTTLPGSYVPDADSSVAWWTDNILTYSGLERPSGCTMTGKTSKKWSVGVALGVVYVETLDDYWRAYERMVANQNAWAYSGWDHLGTWGTDEDFAGNEGSIVRAALTGVIDSLMQAPVGSWWLDSLWDSSVPFGCSNRADAVVYQLNGHDPSLVLISATASRPSSPGSWYGDDCSSHPFNPGDFIQDGKYTMILGMSCGSAGIDILSESSTALQFSTLYAKGASAVIAPTRSIKQREATWYLKRYMEIWRENYTDDLGVNTVTIGEIHQQVRNEMLNAFGTSEGELYVQEIILLGDPTAYPPGYKAGWVWVSVPGNGSGNTPRRFALGSPSPNPFNPSTTIRYAIDRDGPTELTVINVAGRVVRNLVNGYQTAGDYEVVWNGRTDSGRSAVSGIYFCRLINNGRSETQRLTLVR